MVLPSEGYPISTEAIREWFRRTYGREATEKEVGEVQAALAKRDSGPLPRREPAQPGSREPKTG